MRFYTASVQTVRKLEFSLKTGSFEAALPDRRVCDRSKWAKIPQKSGMACHSAEFSHSLDPFPHYPAAADAATMATMQRACTKKNAKRTEVTKSVCKRVMHGCLQIRADMNTRESASRKAPLAPAAVAQTTMAPYTGKFSTQLMCALIARRYHSLPWDPRALPEPCMNLLIHTAPDVRPLP
jgi:hypothetical protein